MPDEISKTFVLCTRQEWPFPYASTETDHVFLCDTIEDALRSAITNVVQGFAVRVVATPEWRAAHGMGERA